MAEDLALQSPEWWLDRLHKKLASLRDPLNTLNDYYVGDHPMVFSSEQFRQVFRGLFKRLSDNWCGVVADAVEERLNVQGFRITQDMAPPPLPDPAQNGDAGPLAELASEATGDQDAWLIWQRNNLDGGSQMGHLEALIHGFSNVLTWENGDGKAVITVEHPTQSYVEYEPGSMHDRAAAIKEWRDDWTGRLMATIYLPDGLYKYVSEKSYKGDWGTGTRVKWLPRIDNEGDPWPTPNPLGVVPMVPLNNKPRLLDECDSEIRGVIPIQDAINKTIADMLVASEFQSYRQRWATGLEIPVDPGTNQPIEPFKSAVNRLWVSEDTDTEFGEFSQADLRIFIAAIEMFVQHVATQSRTPPHYFYLSGQFPSGEAIKSAETGLVAKARRRMTHFGETWEEALRLAFMVEGNPRANAVMSETIWSDPESRSEAEHTDAIVKLDAIGVPKQALWERWGFTPQEIERFKLYRAEDKALAPEPPTVVVSGPMNGPPIPVPAGVPGEGE